MFKILQLPAEAEIRIETGAKRIFWEGKKNFSGFRLGVKWEKPLFFFWTRGKDVCDVFSLKVSKAENSLMWLFSFILAAASYPWAAFLKVR